MQHYRGGYSRHRRSAEIRACDVPFLDALVRRRKRGHLDRAHLLLEGPGADSVFAPMLGPACGTIACVGVAPGMRGRGVGTAMVGRASQLLSNAGTGTCHIGWTSRESFYQRAGYQVWRHYAMFSLSI
jgi:GNAT superfamily N-acetyltransferase